MGPVVASRTRVTIRSYVSGMNSHEKSEAERFGDGNWLYPEELAMLYGGDAVLEGLRHICEVTDLYSRAVSETLDDAEKRYGTLARLSDRERGVFLCATRLWPVIRGITILVGAGYGAETSPAMRQIIELTAQAKKIADNEEGDIARRWLDGKLSSGVKSFQQLLGPELGRAMYKLLSSELHGDGDRADSAIEIKMDDAGPWSPHRVVSRDESIVHLSISMALTMLDVLAGAFAFTAPARRELDEYFDRLPGDEGSKAPE